MQLAGLMIAREPRLFWMEVDDFLSLLFIQMKAKITLRYLFLMTPSLKDLC